MGDLKRAGRAGLHLLHVADRLQHLQRFRENVVTGLFRVNALARGNIGIAHRATDAGKTCFGLAQVVADQARREAGVVGEDGVLGSDVMAIALNGAVTDVQQRGELGGAVAFEGEVFDDGAAFFRGERQRVARFGVQFAEESGSTSRRRIRGAHAPVV